MTEGSFARFVPQDVIEQINVREKKWEGKNYSVGDLEVIHGNTVWCLLRSGIDAPTEYSDRFSILTSEESRYLKRTNKYALEGTLGGEEHPALEGGGFSSKLAGVQLGPNSSDYYYYKTGQGHKPRPGITGFNVKTLDTWGMILECNINIKVWSRDDLDRMDLIYFKPGYPALFEWGHTLYFKPDGSICKNPRPIVSNELFFKPEGGVFKELDDLVYKARKEDSNREAVFGYITNFSWSFNHDGSFDCTLKILSKGGVIEGLKESGGGDEEEKTEKSKAEDDDWWNISDYHRILKALEDSNGKSGTIDAIPTTDSSNVAEYEISLPERDSISGEVISLKEAISSNKVIGLAKEKYIDLQDCPVVRVPLTRRGRKRGIKGYYVTLETLCHIINCIEDPSRVEFKFKLKSVACFGNSTLVKNVTKREVDWAASLNANSSSGGNPWGSIGGWNNRTPVTPLRDSVPERRISAEPVYTTSTENVQFPSINPLVALKPDQLEVRGDKDYRVVTTDIMNQCRRSYKDLKYCSIDRILNIWVCFNEFVALIERTIATQAEYKLEAVIREYLTSIQKAFGNVNQFDLHCDHSIGGGYWELVDRSYVKTGEPGGSQAPVLNVSGLQNTVIDLKVTSDVSPDLVNEMCIAATAPTEGTVGAENADECLVFWGENCKARWVTTSTNRDKTGGSKDTSLKDDDWRESLDKFYETLRKGKIEEGEVSNRQGASQAFDSLVSEISGKILNLQLDGEKFYKTQVQRDARNRTFMPIGIIPYKMTLTLLGTSRLNIGNTFRIRNGILPKKYDNWGYIITGIEHSVRNNQWFTTLTTNYYPVYPNERFTTPTLMSWTTPEGPQGDTGPSKNWTNNMPLSKDRITVTGANSSRGNPQAGDQTNDSTGKTRPEVFTKTYSIGWMQSSDGNYQRIYRNRNADEAAKAAAIAVKLAASPLVGYRLDTNARRTLYEELVEKHNGDVEAYLNSGIATCTDCSAFCHTCYAAVNPKKYGARWLFVTSEMGMLTSHGEWDVYDFRQVQHKTELRIGDILWKPGHVEMVTNV